MQDVKNGRHAADERPSANSTRRAAMIQVAKGVAYVAPVTLALLKVDKAMANSICSDC